VAKGISITFQYFDDLVSRHYCQPGRVFKTI